MINRAWCTTRWACGGGGGGGGGGGKSPPEINPVEYTNLAEFTERILTQCTKNTKENTELSTCSSIILSDMCSASEQLLYAPSSLVMAYMHSRCLNTMHASSM